MYSTLAGPYEYDLDQKRLLVPESDIESANREIAQLRALLDKVYASPYAQSLVKLGLLPADCLTCAETVDALKGKG